MAAPAAPGAGRTGLPVGLLGGQLEHAGVAWMLAEQFQTPVFVMSDLDLGMATANTLAAARAGATHLNTTVNGLGMLLNQARPAFHAWFGVMPEITHELNELITSTL